MKSKLLIVLLLLATTFFIGTAQVPRGFNYQAIARNATGNPLPAGTALQVRLTIQSLSTGGTIFWKELHSSVTTNNFGLFTLVVGNGSRLDGAATFGAIEWDKTPMYIQTEIYYNNSWLTMGAAQMWSVPYSMVADSAKGLTKVPKLEVVGDNDAGSQALFEVRRKDGQPVFAVYNEGIRAYVSDGTKGTKGGFAVGGFGTEKATSQKFLYVDKDSVRIYIDPTPPQVKGTSTKGGFAVGGYGAEKGGISDMYFNLTGASAVNTVAGSPQILWYPVKNAFLAGNVHIGASDSVGNYSTALGYRSIAMGDYSQAFGYRAKAFGDYSTSIGKNSIAGQFDSRHNAFALGNKSEATGEDSYAFGSGAKAIGQKSFSFGSVAIDSSGNALSTPTTASGNFSTAIGMGAQATNTGSLAFGNSSASGAYASLALGFYSTVEPGADYGVAIGYYARSQGVYGQAFGLKAIAGAQGSLAVGPYANTGKDATYAGSFGYRSSALAPYSVSIGYNARTSTTGTSSGSFGYGANAAGPYSISIGPYTTTGSTADYAGSFGYHSDALGKNSVAVGYNAQTTANATSSGAFGYNAIANGPTSVAIGSGASTGATATDAGSFGKSAVANGISSVAIGSSATTGASATNAGSFGYTAAANGANSVAVGYGAITGGTDASAFGKAANASGPTSMALGASAVASGSTSVSIGYSSDATNNYSVAMGFDAQSTGQYSLAMGYQANASNTSATSIGYNTQASGLYSTAMGFNSVASGEKSLALGSYYSYSYQRCFINRLTGQIICSPVTINVTNTAKRRYSVAVGNGNYAEDGGIALGSNNKAYSSGSVALGHSNTADTSYSFAAGYRNNSQGINAIALGENLTAEASNSVVVGSYNTTSTSYNKYGWVETDPLFVVGNGDEVNGGHDALRINKNGGTYINPENAYAGLWVTSSNTSSLTGTYAYGILSNIQRNKDGVSYYSGYFYDSGAGLGTYNGEYADIRSGGSIDVAEYIYDSKANTEPADVVVADINNKESVVKSSNPYQTGVLGVISTKPHMVMGMELVTDEATGEPLKEAKPATRLALTGRVPVNVCGENGPITPGDYLTSSSIPGTAMKWTLLDVNTAKDFDGLKKILAENEKRRNAIIGKAVESFSGSGTGKIMVLISLQ